MDTQSGQLFSQAFTNVVKQIRQNTAGHASPCSHGLRMFGRPGRGIMPGLCQQRRPMAAAPTAACSHDGDFADFTQAISQHARQMWAWPPSSLRTRSTATRDSRATTVLLTLQKNLSHGVQYDFNYTFSHSVDNISTLRQFAGRYGHRSGGGLICDDIRPGSAVPARTSIFGTLSPETRATSCRLVRARCVQPRFRSGQTRSSVAWSVSGIADWHTGSRGNSSNAFVASYSNDAPAILVGQPIAGQEQADQATGRRSQRFCRCQDSFTSVRRANRIPDWST